MKPLKHLVGPATMLIWAAFALPVSAMSYHDNSVTLNGASGITIQDASYTVSDLCITDGQDPDGENQVGDTHNLQNGSFTFRVGRKGSSQVASWFNGKFSGYNDDSVNGDRTTFDEAAGELNFAFLGDLTLTVSTSKHSNLEVTFPDISFAQGSSGFRNNWWFAQENGQHTRDSDGPSSLLAIGEDTRGRLVYASFNRGDNSVNEVTLNAISVVDDADDDARTLSGIQSALNGLSTDGTQINLSGFPGSYDPTTNHIQGYSQYEAPDGTDYVILSHSVSSADYAHIVIGPKSGSTKLGFKTYLKGWRHPGGIQVIGDYLLVGSEQNSSSHVDLYDLRSLAVNELRRVEKFDLSLNHKAGAIGITQYRDNGNKYYLLSVTHLDGSNSVYHMYRANASAGIENAHFSEVGSFPFNLDFQGYGLLTDSNMTDVYMIGLYSETSGATFDDYAYLYQYDTSDWSFEEIQDPIHFYSHGGGVGMMGVHFRYGSNAFIDSDDDLVLCATERNSILGNALATNDWR